MAGIGLSGLASGVDTSGIVDQLMAIERRSTTRIKLDQSRLTARDQGLKDISSKLSALRSAAQALRTPELWADKQTVESSSPAQVAVERLSGAGTGATSVRVVALASSSQRTVRHHAPGRPADLLHRPGRRRARRGRQRGRRRDPGRHRLGDQRPPGRRRLRRRRAHDPSDPASARLVLSSRTTGVASGFTLSEGGAAVADVAAAAKAGRDAAYFLDGETDPRSCAPPRRTSWTTRSRACASR
jgi:flagellar hook-associated protein 2